MTAHLRKYLACCTLLLSAGACGAAVSPYARATAGRIGCPASQIELAEVERGRSGPESWVAYCGRVGYACSSSRALEHPNARIVCSELGRPAHVEHDHDGHERDDHERGDRPLARGEGHQH